MPSQDDLGNEMSRDRHAESGGGAATKTLGHSFDKIPTICFQEQRRWTEDCQGCMARRIHKTHKKQAPPRSTCQVRMTWAMSSAQISMPSQDSLGNEIGRDQHAKAG